MRTLASLQPSPRRLPRVFFFACFSWTSVLCVAQVPGNTISDIYVPLDSKGVASSSFSLGGTKVAVTEIEPVAKSPMHVAFVIDGAKHQAGMLQLTQDYVKAITQALKDDNVGYRAIVTGAAKLTEEAPGDAFLNQLPQLLSDSSTDATSAESLSRAIQQSIESLPDSGGGAVIVISDGDDDVSDKSVKSLSTTLAKHRVRLYSILLAFHDFYGTRTHSRWGINLEALSSRSGGDQHETNYQLRSQDAVRVTALAKHIPFGTLVSIPASESAHGSSPKSLEIRTADGKKLRSAQFLP